MTRNPDHFLVERLASWPAVAPLRADWNTLAECCVRPSVFLSHEWFEAAWQWRALECELSVLAVHRGAGLAGALPLVARRVRSRSGTRRVLELLSVPDTQHFDLLAQRDDSADVSDALARWLRSQAARWDVFEIGYLPVGSAVESALLPALRANGCRVRVEDGGSNPYIPLEQAWEAYYAGRSRSLKKANNLAANRLRKSGDVAITVYRDGDAAELTARLTPLLADISGRSWKRATGNSLDFPGPQAFIRRLTERAVERGWLSVWLLHLDGKPLAMEYQLACGGDVHALRSDFDAAYAEISPGSHLFRELLEKLFGMARGRYYMGPGENAYKLRWTEHAEPLRRVRAYSPSVRGHIAALVDLHVTPAARALRDRFAPKQPGAGPREDDPGK